jgi:RNA-directed DNA polymerase
VIRAIRQTQLSRHEPFLGSSKELRKSLQNAKRTAQVNNIHEAYSINVCKDDGCHCSSYETFVMKAERRMADIPFHLCKQLKTFLRMTDLFETKPRPIPITKDMVREAYRKVRANKGSAGIDEESLEEFQTNLFKNLYKIWNRLSSGSYFPMPVKLVMIPKANGGKRPLGIPTISDRVAQEVVKSYLEPRLEKVFLPNSYGYRPHKSAHQAIAKVRENVRQFAWVIDMDIQRFFEEVSHELLLKAIAKHVQEKWVLLYIKRWLEVPTQSKDGLVFNQGKGTPQGAVISPLLANLFLHYVLDKWLEKKFPSITFVRYADDVIIHCKSEAESKAVLSAIKARLEDCKLGLSEKKTKISYCKNYLRTEKNNYSKYFDFLGFRFKPMSKKSNRGGMFLGFDCGISLPSRTRIINKWRAMNFHRRSTETVQSLAEILNPISRGIIRYYATIDKWSVRKLFFHLELRLAKWVKNKYKSTKNSYKKSYDWLGSIKASHPTMFYHWTLFTN